MLFFTLIYLQLSCQAVIAIVFVLILAIVVLPEVQADVLPAILVMDFIVSQVVLPVGFAVVITDIINIQIVQHAIGHTAAVATKNTAATEIMCKGDGSAKVAQEAPATVARVPGQLWNTAAAATKNTAATATMSREDGLSRAAQEPPVTKVPAIGG